ncbi:tRNA 4-thiouridine(8) synthase ThiI [Candidatus Woesearchaeota archaeon]|nr:tRNA 4-thiouridine(8) synthase ThiI [Candidatus Woesearchaeota archaeon]
MGEFAIIHYAEIGLRGKNRSFFENLLIDNIKKKLGADSIVRETGQIRIDLKEIDISKAEEVLKRIPGIAYFSFAKRSKLDVDSIKKDVLEFLKDKKFETFKVDAMRRDKTVKIDSQELNYILGEEIIKKYKKKAKMKDCDLLLKIEMTTKNAYISAEDIKAVGGIPTKMNQKVVALLSGGFDSPVAAYLMMKRGCSVILVHFQNRNQMTNAVQDKIEKLAGQLSRYQINTKLYIVPFDDIQKQIIANVRSEMRMLVYRKFMLKISSEIAKKEKAKFLVVGDSLSQVASQTLENLSATYFNSEKPILSPLIGMDKDEIIKISRRIGTYDISELPYGDCCSYFVPKHPELKAKAGELDKAFSDIDVSGLVEEAVEKVKVKDY